MGKNWIKKLAEDFKKKNESAGGVDVKNIGAGVKNWKPIIERITKEMHVDLKESTLNLPLKLIQTESGGNQSVTQPISDINQSNGDPAKVLLQYITATFSRYMGILIFYQRENNFNNSNFERDLQAWAARMARGITG